MTGCPSPIPPLARRAPFLPPHLRWEESLSSPLVRGERKGTRALGAGKERGNRSLSEHRDCRADLHVAIELFDIGVEHADAAGRYGFADGGGFVGAVDAIDG